MPIGTGWSRSRSPGATSWPVQTLVSVGPYKFSSRAFVQPRQVADPADGERLAGEEHRTQPLRAGLAEQPAVAHHQSERRGHRVPDGDLVIVQELSELYRCVSQRRPG